MRLAITSILLLTGVSVAQAECAWVLWGTPAGAAQESSWRPLDAFKAERDCRTRLARLQESPDKDSKLDTKYGIYRCLPDTVDLRGPKAAK